MQSVQGKYNPVIGLEVHAQLLTTSKIFCHCSTEFGTEPNTNVCPVCMGHPGVLPVLNKQAVDFILMMGFACECRLNTKTFFARKNYFYPDLPKGYQISQFEIPFCEDGNIQITLKSGERKNIRIRRIHLEEDAGKLIHSKSGTSAVDLNRCGVPLIEIVTEPDINSPEEAYIYLTKIKQILKYLRVSDCNMEEGSLRCDANISISMAGKNELGTKTELKNMNSFRNVGKALYAEIERQTDLLESGKRVVQETLLWDADSESVMSMRSKEEAHDYRYFPEPDLVRVNIPESVILVLKNSMPELADDKRKKFEKKYNLPSYDAEVLCSERDIAEFYEAACSYTDYYKLLSNWVMTEVMAICSEDKKGRVIFPVSPLDLGELVSLIGKGEISQRIAKEVFSEMFKLKKKPLEIINEKNLRQINDSGAISAIIEKMLQESAKEIDEFISGKEKVFGYFVGRIMKLSGGKVNPSMVNEILKQKLESIKKKHIQE